MSGEIQKWCQPHWDELRQMVSDRGLDKLVARGGAAAAKQVERERRTGNARDGEGFDPLLRAWGMLNARALELGMGLFEGCPPCWVQRHHDECKQPNCEKPTPAEWMGSCMDSLLAYAREKGLVETS